MSLDLPSYEEATKNQNITILKATLVQPSSGRFIHHIPDEIQPGIPSRQFIIMEKCPACGFGVLKETYSIPGLLWAIICFPCGMICCMASKEKQCAHCVAKYPCNTP